MFEQSLALNRAALASDHPDVALSMWHLANLYRDQKFPDSDKAKEVGSAALVIFERALGHDHPQTICCRRDWG